MTTFGERLKELRKNKQLGQMELAEQIGVSVQSVSRWETGSCMPDIFQIVPLAKVLGTTADYLLGMDSSEEDDITKAYEKVNELTRYMAVGNKTEGERPNDIAKQCYDLLFPLASRYPMNYTLLLKCSMFGSYYLDYMVNANCCVYTEKEINTLYNDLERMLSTVFLYEKNLGLKGEAKERLVYIHCIMGHFGKAELESEDLNYKDRMKMYHTIASFKNDTDEQIVNIKKLLNIHTRELFTNLWTLGQSYFAQGKVKRKESIAVWLKIIDMANAHKDVFSEERRLIALLDAYTMLAKEFLREDDIKTALDYINKATDIGVLLYNWTKDNVEKNRINNNSGAYVYEETFFIINDEKSAENLSSEEILNKTKKAIKWCIASCIDEYNDKDTVEANQKYKDCMVQLELLV